MGIKRDRKSEEHLRSKFLNRDVIITKGGASRKGTVRQVCYGHVAGKYEDGTTFYVSSKHVIQA